jgi:hypothetical protein
MRITRFTGEILLSILQNRLKRDFLRPLSLASLISPKSVLYMSVRGKKGKIDLMYRKL